MTITKREVYETADGSVFETLDEAEAYLATVEQVNMLLALTGLSRTSAEEIAADLRRAGYVIVRRDSLPHDGEG
jgi:hypothetical protein